MNSAIGTGIFSKLQLLFRSILFSRRFVWIVLGLAFALRLGWVLAWPNEQFIGDYIWLNSRAHDLAEGRGYYLENGQPTAFWPIGYPLSLSLLYRVFGENDLAGKLANILYSMGGLVALYALGQRLFTETTARLALLLLAVSPNAIAYNSLLATEPLFTLLFLIGLVIGFDPSPKRSTGALLGAVLGIAANVKPVTLGLFPILFLGLWMVRRDWRPALAQTGIAIIAMLVILSPWLMRNREVFGRWVLTNEAGLVMLVGNNPDATGQYHRAPIIMEIYPKLQQGGEEEYRWNKEAQRLAIQFIRKNPGRFIQLGFQKLFHMYRHDVDGIWHTLNGVQPKVSTTVWNFLTRLGHGYYASLILMVAGYIAWRVIFRLPLGASDLLWLFVAYFSFVCFVFHGLPRYHYPIMPLFCLFAGRFVEWLVHKPINTTIAR